MIDALGIVNKGTANTGAAVYKSPESKLGKTPLDDIAAGLKKEREGIEKEQEAEQKAKENQDKKIQNEIIKLDEKGFHKDRENIFRPKLAELKQKHAALRSQGIDLQDYNDPETVKFWEEVDMVKNDIDYSAVAQQDYYKWANTAKANPTKYDYEETVAGLNEFMSLPLEERKNQNITDYVKLKDVPFDQYLLGGTVGNAYKSDAQIKEYINLQTTNPKYKKHIEEGVAAGLWKDEEDFKNQQYAYAKSKRTQRLANAKPRTVTKNNVLITESSPAAFDAFTGGHISTLGHDAVQLGGVDVSIGGPDARYVIDNSDMSGQYTTMNGGTMQNVFVGKNGNVAAIPYDPANPKAIYTYKSHDTMVDDSGNTVSVEITGTYDQIVAELIDRGLGSFQTMVFGSFENKDKKTVNVWVPASKVINGGGMAKYADAYKKLQARKSELNSEYKSKVSWPEWKKANPSGTRAQFEAYLKQ
jgi:hypothetical protein